MTQNLNNYKIKYQGRYIEWCGMDLEPVNGTPGYVLQHVSTDNPQEPEHVKLEVQLEITYRGEPYWHSPDVCFPGMVKTYG